MGCVSATLRLVLPRHPLPPGSVAGSWHRLRDLEHNPQRHVTATGVDIEAAARARAVAEAIHLRAHQPQNRPARRRVFVEIRECNRRINALQPQLRRAYADELAARQRQAVENRAAGSREYFFAMHPRRELEMLLERMPSVHDISRSAIV